MGLYDFSFYDLIERNAVCFCNRPAWYEVDDHRAMTFAEYKKSVDQLACGLQFAGIKKGDRIGALGKNSLEFFCLYGAAGALGAIVLPINWRLSIEEALFNLNDCEPKILFVDPEYQEMIGASKDKLPSVKKYYSLKSAGDEFTGFDSLMKNDGNFQAADVSTDDGLVIIHTAAVAGRPRGALLSHGNLICANTHIGLQLNLSAEDVHLSILPLFHVGGLFMATGSFHSGVLNVNMSKFDAVEAVSLIEEKKVSVMFDFSPILGSILEEHKISGKNIETLQHVAGLESPAVIEEYQKLTGGTFICMYGQTETSAIATMGRYADRPGSAGQVIQLSNVQIVDDNDQPLPAGNIGEIAVKGPMVFKGYWNLAEDTARAFRGGWQHTGDLGRFDEDGFLWYEGRKAEKELIKPGGENVYPAEVEKAILEHPTVEEVVVFGVPDPKWKEGIKAVCRLGDGQTLEPRELTTFVGTRIASFKKPQYVEFVLELPKGEDGSVDRAKVKELYGGPQG
ncbi:MAG: AMP-binding protein [Desulfobacterales bacterium]|jgi:long-chain acyl-CoA synthetase